MNIPATYATGGAGLTSGGSASNPKLADVLRDVADDFETLRLAIAGICAKLDADAGVTDTNYAATLAVLTASIKTKKV